MTIFRDAHHINYNDLPDPHQLWEEQGDFVLVGFICNLELAVRNPYYQRRYGEKLQAWLNEAWTLTPAWFDLFCRYQSPSIINEVIQRTQGENE